MTFSSTLTISVITEISKQSSSLLERIRCLALYYKVQQNTLLRPKLSSYPKVQPRQWSASLKINVHALTSKLSIRGSPIQVKGLSSKQQMLPLDPTKSLPPHSRQSKNTDISGTICFKKKLPLSLKRNQK